MKRGTCARCDSKLNPEGRCPGTAPLLLVDGREYGTVQQLVHRLGADITVAMVRRWRGRADLTTVEGHSPLDQAARIEADKRLGGRGRPRRLDVTATLV